MGEDPLPPRGVAEPARERREQLGVTPAKPHPGKPGVDLHVELADASDPPASMLLPMIVLAFATVAFGIETRLTGDLAREIASGLIGGLR